MNLTRFNVQLNDQALEYLDSEANRIGISRSGMVALMLDQYRSQKETFTAFDNMKKVMEDLEKAGALSEK